jgi:hypothetical protein
MFSAAVSSVVITFDDGTTVEVRSSDVRALTDLLWRVGATLPGAISCAAHLEHGRRQQRAVWRVDLTRRESHALRHVLAESRREAD